MGGLPNLRTFVESDVFMQVQKFIDRISPGSEVISHQMYAFLLAQNLTLTRHY